MSRPRISINALEVEKLAILQCTTEEMGWFFGCDRTTIEKRFSREIAKGRETGRISIRRRQYQKAMTGNATMLIWLGKQWLGQSDRPEAREDAPRRQVFVIGGREIEF